jgi:hypothetical protein
MRRRWLGVWLCLVAGCSGAGCGGGREDRVTECDAMRATLEQIGACPRLPAAQRAQIDQAVRTIRDSLDRLEDVGPDRAPPDLLEETRRTCAKQDGELRRLYEKVAPECLR